MIFFIYYHSFHLGWFPQSFRRFILVLFTMILPISFWIFWNVKKGTYSNADVSNQLQRRSLYIVIICSILVYISINIYLN
ncbi:MAG: hypothetical protein Q4C75_05090 [Bergeyella zoohelcum]|nr:hypothetical protein [Bergeyella zoohelcum]